MTPTQLQEHFRNTYFSLRFGLGVLAFVLPALLVLYGYFIEQISIQSSMSAYYFAFAPEGSPLRVFPMRGFFVGILWAIGCFLILYSGYSKTENWLLNLAGVCALGVAIFPMEASCTNCVSVDLHRFHYFFAYALFVFITLVAWFCNKDSLRALMDEQTQKENELKKQLGSFQGAQQQKVALEKRLRELQNEHKRNSPDHFRLAYRLLGTLMIALPTAAVGIAYFTRTYEVYNRRLLVAEWAAIWVFAIYWLVKSYELYLSRADEKATTGKMTVTEPAAEVSKTMRHFSEGVRRGVSSRIANLRK